MANQFQETQYQFAAYIRDPEHQPIPDQLESRRMAIYRDLFFNNIERPAPEYPNGPEVIIT